MSRLLDTHQHFLHLLLVAKKDQRKALLRTIDKSQLKVLTEIAHNVLKGTVALSEEEKKTLRKYRKIIVTLGSRRGTRKSKLEVIRRGAKAVFELVKVVGTWTK